MVPRGFTKESILLGGRQKPQGNIALLCRLAIEVEFIQYIWKIIVMTIKSG